MRTALIHNIGKAYTNIIKKEICRNVFEIIQYINPLMNCIFSKSVMKNSTRTNTIACH